MATTVEYIEFVCGEISGNYDIRYKKCLASIWFT